MPEGSEVGGRQGLGSRAVAPVRPPVEPAGGGEVGDGRALVGVGEGAEQDGAARDALDAGDLGAVGAGELGIEDVAVPGVRAVVTPPNVVMLMLTVKDLSSA